MLNHKKYLIKILNGQILIIAHKCHKKLKYFLDIKNIYYC